MTNRTLASVLKTGAVSFEDAKGQTREVWLETRRKGIGGSEAGAILGLNPYASPLTVYFSKKGIGDFEGNAATEWGNILENPIRKKAGAELGGNIEGTGGSFVSNAVPFMRANLDGVLRVKSLTLDGVTVKGLGGWECKTTGQGFGFGSDEIPDSYYAQVQHYMAVTGLPWFVLTAFLMGRREVKHYIVPRHEAFIKDMVECERDFWEHNVLADEPPAPIGIAAEAELVKRLPSAASVELPKECEALLDQLETVKAQIKEFEAQKTAIETQLKLNLSEVSKDKEASAKTIALCGGWVVTWNEQTRRLADSEALKKAGLFEQYSKESISKVLRVTHAK